MTFDFEELDYQETPLGAISLRRRAEPRLQGKIVFEVRLGDEFLMSSLFTESEIQLAKLGLAGVEGNNLDVIVGGLGLGYTAIAALEDSRVSSLVVIDVMEPVISWHKNELVPLGEQLNADSRCTLRLDDFFAVAAADSASFFDEEPERKVHAVLLDIDHSPKHWLNPGNSSFYCTENLEQVARKIHTGGVFAVWSNDPPDDAFIELLNTAFSDSTSHIVSFPNPYMGGESSCSVYVAHKV